MGPERHTDQQLMVNRLNGPKADPSPRPTSESSSPSQDKPTTGLTHTGRGFPGDKKTHRSVLVGGWETGRPQPARKIRNFGEAGHRAVPTARQ